MAGLTPLEDLPLQSDVEEPQLQAPMQQQAPVYCPAPPAPIAVVHADSAPAQSTSWHSAILEMITSPVFLKALAVSVAIVFAVTLFPVEGYVLKHIPMLESLPNSAALIKAVVAGVAITLMRPPSLRHQ